MIEKALGYLRTSLDQTDAQFRPGQWESIYSLLQGGQVLVVQRTGWGKSVVYFIATKLLREAGRGPTLLISPLLSLMRNQLEAAERIGVKARAINHTNHDEWDSIQTELLSDEIDVLLISPERLANADFKENMLAGIIERIGLFVVDEAHCISDWGHDFRPDYRRIIRVLQSIPKGVPVLATTATANDRVVTDIKAQMPVCLEVQRGPLVRSSLMLQNILLPSPASRMAWLLKAIPSIQGSGIVYALTQRDAERVADWLLNHGISAEAYHAGSQDRAELERKLIDNELKVLVATVALGMGFDKPDLSFVIHFQRPSSVVHYYQQVGRAGRAIDKAYGILLCGEEDDRIADFFINSAFPPQQHITEVMEVLRKATDGMTTNHLMHSLNLRSTHIDKALKFLSVESPSPVVKQKSKWYLTPAAEKYEMDRAYIESILRIRRDEQTQMKEYMTHKGCLMVFLQNALDDPNAVSCGKCFNCDSSLLFSDHYEDSDARDAALFLRRSYITVRPKRVWPGSGVFQHYPFEGYRIPQELMAAEGRALSLWGDAGWGQMVVDGKYENGEFPDALVQACFDMIRFWNPDPFPEWVTCIPSKNHPELVPGFALRLAEKLGVPFTTCIQLARSHDNQKFMENKFHQVTNLDGAFKVIEPLAGNCLLIDDMIDSGWTFTIASALLRHAGCETVYPLALAKNSPRLG
ncbi:MAG TPA: RecQ family ATP-dependent DNA helicase [Candidatus Sabulitectum sp.]|nr:RecQ family ATP-dependent DNA helicase [Candidatus Sabulitectum sp.]